jgi:hypothetical protein
MFGVPPPNPEPHLEDGHHRTPRERLESYFFGFIAIAVVLIVIAVVQAIL